MNYSTGIVHITKFQWEYSTCWLLLKRIMVRTVLAKRTLYDSLSGLRSLTSFCGKDSVLEHSHPRGSTVYFLCKAKSFLNKMNE